MLESSCISNTVILNALLVCVGECGLWEFYLLALVEVRTLLSTL